MQDGPLVFDPSGWPLVDLRWSAEHDNEAAVRDFVEGLRGLLSRRRSFALVIDGRGARALDAGSRRQLAREMRALEPQMRRYLVGCAILMDSALLRGVLTAMHWLVPPPFAVEVFAHPSDARAWARLRVPQERVAVRARAACAR